MRLPFSDAAWEDYLHWQHADKRKVARINTLLKAIVRTPYEGIGKPQRLRFDQPGWWSRRIDQEHRAVYRVEAGVVLTASLRFHYQAA